MKIIVRLGRPVHFHPGNCPVTACGLPIYDGILAAYDGRDTTCLNCTRTKKWKSYITKDSG